jgi:hypothetical protein
LAISPISRRYLIAPADGGETLPGGRKIMARAAVEFLVGDVLAVYLCKVLEQNRCHVL